MISAIEDKIKVEIKRLLLLFYSNKYCNLLFCRYNTELFDVNGALLACNRRTTSIFDNSYFYVLCGTVICKCYF